MTNILNARRPREAPTMIIIVERTGRTWSVFANGRLVEGGFFSRDSAQSCANELRTEYPEITDADLR